MKRHHLFSLILAPIVGLATALNNAHAQGSTQCMLGDVRMFAGTIVPDNWTVANGQIILIQQNTLLFSLLGTIYGGDGQTTFGLPNLSGRSVIGAGAGQGLTPRTLGQPVGAQTIDVRLSAMPSHNHAVELNLKINATGVSGQSDTPAANSVFANSGNLQIYAQTPPVTSLNPNSVSATLSVDPAGGTPTVNNYQQSYGMTHLICIDGYYPSRN